MKPATDLATEVLSADINNSLTLLIVMLGFGFVVLAVLFVYAQKGTNRTSEKASDSLVSVIKSSSDVTSKVMAYIERNTDVLHTQTNKLTNIDDHIKGGFSGVQNTLTKIERERIISQATAIDEAVEKTKQSLSVLEKSLLEQLMPLSTNLAVLRAAIEGMSTTGMAQHKAVLNALEAIARTQEQIIKTAEKANDLPKPTNGTLIKSRSFTADEEPKPINESLIIQTRNED